MSDAATAADAALRKAVQSVMSETAMVRSVRENENVAVALAAFKKNTIYFVNYEAIRSELQVMRSQEIMKGLMIEGTGGIEDANNLRTACRNDRVRCMEILRNIRALRTKVNRYLRMLRPYLREVLGDAKRAKTEDDVIMVALDPLYFALDSYAIIKEDVEDVIRIIDDTLSAIDSWFYLHKQHVFLTRNTHDPDKEPEAPRRRRV